MTEDETVGWQRRLNGHEFEQAPGVSDGQDLVATKLRLSTLDYLIFKCT